MTNPEIIQKAIKKAQNNDEELRLYSSIDLMTMEIGFKSLLEEDVWRSFIFSHQFAKAFWGENKIKQTYGNFREWIAWKYHLPIMVLEEEPLKYLEKFL